MILQKGKECTRDAKLISETGPSQRHYFTPIITSSKSPASGKWNYTENVQNNQFHSPCVYVLLIVTLATIRINYMVCIFGVCPREVMDADHPRPASISLWHLSDVACQGQWREMWGGYIFNMKWEVLCLAVVWVHIFDCFHLLHCSVRSETWKLFSNCSWAM